jgi:hypothetical protein
MLCGEFFGAEGNHGRYQGELLLERYLRECLTLLIRPVEVSIPVRAEPVEASTLR